MIDLKQITLHRGGKTLLSAFDLTVNSGEAVQLKGPNGVGKSSLLRLCAGLLKEFEGMASLPAMSDTLYFGHKYGLQGVLSGVENLRYHCALRDQRPSEGELVDALNQFQLGASMLSRVADLSEGQRKRVALSKLVFAGETVWLLDEAFSSLDTEGLSTLTALCAAHVAKGGTLLFTSHQSVSLSVPVRVIDLGAA